jgi:L-ascorbate metabolism protein UlaG (beta-lactamase superfamily)
MIELGTMEIKYQGAQTIMLKSKKENILIDPQKGVTQIDSRVIIFTERKFNYLGLDNEKVIIDGPGEYEVGGVEVRGLKVADGKMMYVIEADGVIVGVLGEIGEMLDEKQIEKIAGIDVLLVSIDECKIKSKVFADLAKKWGANYLIPVGYKKDGESLKKFLDEVDEEGLEAIDSLKIDRDNLPDGLEVIILKC